MAALVTDRDLAPRHSLPVGVANHEEETSLQPDVTIHLAVG
jgi:hypothetical protein